MPSSLRDICFDCADATKVAMFWRDVLGYDMSPPDPTPEYREQLALTPSGGGLRIWFNPVAEPKVVKNRLHIDINMPDADEMARIMALGAKQLGEIRGDDGVLWWTVMADPEENEFCAFPPRN